MGTKEKTLRSWQASLRMRRTLCDSISDTMETCSRRGRREVVGLKEHQWERPLWVVGNLMLLFCDMRDQIQGLTHTRQALPHSHNPWTTVEVLYSDCYHGCRTQYCCGNSTSLSIHQINFVYNKVSKANKHLLKVSGKLSDCGEVRMQHLPWTHTGGSS